jgi:hypothetical protein
MAHKCESHQPSLFDEETPRVALCPAQRGNSQASWRHCCARSQRRWSRQQAGRASMSKITAKHPQRSACVISVNQPRISSCTILKSAAAIWACRLRQAARLDEGRDHRRRSRTIGRRRRAARLRAAAAAICEGGSGRCSRWVMG